MTYDEDPIENVGDLAQRLACGKGDAQSMLNRCVLRLWKIYLAQNLQTDSHLAASDDPFRLEDEGLSPSLCLPTSCPPIS